MVCIIVLPETKVTQLRLLTTLGGRTIVCPVPILRGLYETLSVPNFQYLLLTLFGYQS